MQILDLEQLDTPFANPTALALGFFDSFHVGHRRLLEVATRSAYTPAMFTFRGDFYGALGLAEKPVYSAEQRAYYAANYGIDAVFYLPADAEHFNMTPQDFLNLLLKANPSIIVCGADFRFGCGAAGDIDMLRAFASAHHIRLDVLPIQKDSHGNKIGTQAVRKCVAEGDMFGALSLLGRPYSIRGMVQRGRGEGRRLGFPTANIPLDSRLQAPAFGVYACLVSIEGDAATYPAVTNVGPHPTFGDDTVNAETYLFNRQEDCDLYNAQLEIHFYMRLRGICRFDDTAALQAQIKEDCRRAATLFDVQYD